MSTGTQFTPINASRDLELGSLCELPATSPNPSVTKRKGRLPFSEDDPTGDSEPAETGDSHDGPNKKRPRCPASVSLQFLITKSHLADTVSKETLPQDVDTVPSKSPSHHEHVQRESAAIVGASDTDTTTHGIKNTELISPDLISSMSDQNPPTTVLVPQSSPILGDHRPSSDDPTSPLTDQIVPETPPRAAVDAEVDQVPWEELVNWTGEISEAGDDPFSAGLPDVDDLEDIFSTLAPSPKEPEPGSASPQTDYSLGQSEEENITSILEYIISGQTERPSTNEDSGIHDAEVDEEPDLLDEDIDWTEVMSVAEPPTAKANVELQNDDRLETGSPARSETQLPLQLPGQQQHTDHRNDTCRPFARPPFPEKIVDRSVIPGAVSSTVLRTCFRIGELINAYSQCTRARQHAVFELFARVTYSSRDYMPCSAADPPTATNASPPDTENNSTQYFQFKDLFSERQPFPTGTLNACKPDSIIDQQAKDFIRGDNLASSQPDEYLCRCICQIRKKAKQVSASCHDDMGWELDIASIRATSWDEIHWIRRMLARDGEVDE